MIALLQFDAAALPVLTRLLDEGRLPVLADLKRRGTWLPMDAAATVVASATYPTLCTGIDLGDHGLYSAFPWSASDQRVRFMHAFPKPRTIWERLTAARRRALVVDPILAWAPPSMAGVYVNGWNFEDRMLTRAESTPPDARRMAAARHGRPPALHDVYGHRQGPLLLEWRRHLVAAPARVAALAEDLLARESFDGVWINFSAAHKAGHQLWDPASVVAEPLDPGVERILCSGLDDVYAAVDTAIGRIVERLPSDADVIVYSPTGMGANTSRADLLPGMVRAVLGARTRGSEGAAFRAPVWSLRSRIPAQWRASLANFLPDRLAADITTRLYMRADWTRTKAMAVPGENKGYVRLNLKGREREGIVERSEADDLLETLVDGLQTFDDPDGSPAVAQVRRMSDLVPAGSAVDRLPDLVVQWSDQPSARVTAVRSPRYGEVIRRGVGSGRSGNHTDEAWAIVLTGSSRLRDVGRAVRATDLGATICHQLGADTGGLSGLPLLEDRQLSRKASP